MFGDFRIDKRLEAAVGVLVSYGQIIPQTVLDVFPHGIINIHPSLLPLYRGSTPIESAILEGLTDTGVSIMKLSNKMDEGPVYAQKTYSMPAVSSSCKQTAATELLSLGAGLLLDILPGILDGSIQPAPQDNVKATYSHQISKTDGIINWNKDAQTIEREVAAHAGWPRSHTSIAGKEVVITEATAVETPSSPGSLTADKRTLEIGCKQGSLRIHKLIPSGKKEMPVQAFLAGYKL